MLKKTLKAESGATAVARCGC